MATVLDTNLLLLLVVGLASRKYIPLHKRLRAYTVEDYDLLSTILRHETRLIVTPNTLTETSNLAAHIAEPARAAIFRSLKTVARLCEEHYQPGLTAVTHADFFRLGLTDAVLLIEALEPCTLLTADLGLYLAAQRQGSNSVNFNHLREAHG